MQLLYIIINGIKGREDIVKTSNPSLRFGGDITLARRDEMIVSMIHLLSKPKSFKSKPKTAKNPANIDMCYHYRPPYHWVHVCRALEKVMEDYHAKKKDRMANFTKDKLCPSRASCKYKIEDI